MQLYEGGKIHTSLGNKKKIRSQEVRASQTKDLVTKEEPRKPLEFLAHLTPLNATSTEVLVAIEGR